MVQAVVCGQLEALMLLLAKGALVSTGDSQGAHPLHYATVADNNEHDGDGYGKENVENGEDILHVLLKHGAAVNCRDIDGRTPMLWAASNGNIYILPIESTNFCGILKEQVFLRM